MAPHTCQSSGWQVYVYFKIKPEMKEAAIAQSLQLAKRVKSLGVIQHLKARADSSSDRESTHTLMEVYTPSDCNDVITLEDFLQHLLNCSLTWAANLTNPPQRITEVFVDVGMP